MTLELVPWRGQRVPVLSGEIVRYNVAELLARYQYGQYQQQVPPPVTTYGTRPAEPISYSFEGFVQGMLYADGPVAAAEAYRLRVFGQAPLLYQKMDDGRPADFFDDASLDRLRSPWAGATLSDLMKRALVYGDFAGNAFILDMDELVLVRPDWVEIVLAKRMWRGVQVGWRQVGIVYYEGGRNSGVDGAPFLPGEYAHFVSGLPDPLATYRGMSWLTPLIREVQADKSAMEHKVAFFENAASPNLAVSLPKEVTPAQFDEFVELMDSKHKGAAQAYKTLYTGGGADVTVIGANMQQMDFSAVQGKGETRVANMAGVPPVLLSFSEGMQGSSLNAGNYIAAKRNFVDTTMRDLWQNFAGSVQQMDAFAPPKKKSRLWYDGRDIPFLHEDAKDTAEITKSQILSIEAGMRAGFKPDPMVQAVRHNNLELLIGEHTGLFSVQMQAPKTGQDAAAAGLPPSDVPVDPNAPPPVPTDATGAPDFGALRADLVDEDWDEVARAVADMLIFDDEEDVDEDEVERKYNPDQLRVPAGFEGGGRFRSLSDRLVALLTTWAHGDGPDDPLKEHGFSRKQLQSTITELRKKALDAGDHERAARLTPPRAKAGESEQQVVDRLKTILYTDVRAHAKSGRGEPKPSATFTLQGHTHGRYGQDVAVYRDPQGRPALFKVDAAGHRGAQVGRFDDLAGLEKWASDNGEPHLAEWARKERGGPSALATGDGALHAAAVDLHGAREQAAYRDYVSKYRHVNGLLRENGGQIPEGRQYATERQLTAGLDSAMARSGTSADIRVHRLTGTAEFGGGVPTVGHEWTDHGYVSTSVRPKTPHRGEVALEIHVPKGTRAVSTSELDTGEVLLDRGTRFRVTHVGEPDSFGVRHVDVEVVPSGKERGGSAPHAAPAKADTVMVYDVAQDKFREVPRAEAIAGYQRHINSTLKPGEPARAVAEQRLVKMAKGGDDSVFGAPYIAKPAPAKKATPRKATPKIPDTPSLTGEGGLSSDPAVREVQVENRIRAAYAKHRLSGGFAPLASIRAEMPDVPRAEQDAVLKRLAVTPGVSVIPWDNTKALRQPDHEAALHFGGGPNHAVRFEDSSPRPLPTAAPSAPSVSAPRTVADLRTLAKQRGVKIPAGSKKADMLALLGFGGTAGGTASSPAAAFDAWGIADSIQNDIDRWTMHGSAPAAPKAHAQGEEGLRQKLGGLNVGQLRRVAARYRMHPPTGMTSSQLLDWMLAQWASERGRVSWRSEVLDDEAIQRADDLEDEDLDDVEGDDEELTEEESAFVDAALDEEDPAVDEIQAEGDDATG